MPIYVPGPELQAKMDEKQRQLDSVIAGESFVMPEDWTFKRTLSFLSALARRIRKDNSLCDSIFKWINDTYPDKLEYGGIICAILAENLDDEILGNILDSKEWNKYMNRIE